MKKTSINLTGLVSTTRTVHGVEVRGLNFADISAQWQKNGKSLIDAYDKIVAEGVSPTKGDIVSVVNDIVKFAPELACEAFLAAINDDGEAHEVLNGDQPSQMTAREVWEHHMGVGKQIEVLIAIFELTVSESDTLKKIFKFPFLTTLPTTSLQTKVDLLTQN